MDYIVIAVDELIARALMMWSNLRLPGRSSCAFTISNAVTRARVLFELRIARWQRAASACKASGRLREWSDAARLD